MTKSDLISAELIYDGGDHLLIPDRLGSPSETQMQGKVAERLCELAGRVCYDSLGSAKSRPSAEYHEHIHEVGHLSVYEHAVFTVWMKPPPSPGQSERVLYSLMNRPGVFVRYELGTFRVTINLRALIEYKHLRSDSDPITDSWVRATLLNAVRPYAPVVLDGEFTAPDSGWAATCVAPETEDEKWVTMLITGSRGMSHELVRHGDWTAISQRSTRYVDENESPWVYHPLVIAFLDNDRGLSGDSVARAAAVVQTEATNAYGLAVRELESWLTGRDVHKFSARKQARGAARGYLGNALYTEVIFSASVAQWRRMLKLRCHDAADAEIRQVFERALRVLWECRHGGHFGDLDLRPSADGIGNSIAL